MCGCVDQPGRLAGTECFGESPTNRGYGAHFIQGVLFNPRCALSVFSSLLPYSVFSVFCPRFFFFIVTPLAFQKEKEIKLELRLVSEGWLQENMLHTFSDSKANAHILKL